MNNEESIQLLDIILDSTVLLAASNRDKDELFPKLRAMCYFKLAELYTNKSSFLSTSEIIHDILPAVEFIIPLLKKSKDINVAINIIKAQNIIINSFSNHEFNKEFDCSDDIDLSIKVLMQDVFKCFKEEKESGGIK